MLESIAVIAWKKRGSRPESAVDSASVPYYTLVWMRAEESEVKSFMAQSRSRLFVSRRRVRAFTLVEMFIVGALIALFAGIAIVNVQQQFVSNKRKAMIGEARQLGTALGFAKLDLDIYPRLCFLESSGKQLQFEATRRGLTAGYLYTIMDYNDIMVNGPTWLDFSVRLLNNWKGPYFSASQNRPGSAQGRAGFVNMTVPKAGGVPFRWPADGWGNPWVLYLVSLQLNVSGGSPVPYFVGNPPNQAVESPSVNADYLTAVVSYGPNHMPGGGTQVDPALSLATMQLRLYNAVGTNAEDFRGIDYTMLTLSEHTTQRAAALSNQFGTGGLALNDDDVPTGILDVGSDDIVYEF